MPPPRCSPGGSATASGGRRRDHRRAGLLESRDRRRRRSRPGSRCCSRCAGVVAIGRVGLLPDRDRADRRLASPATRSRALSLHQTAVFAGAGLGALVATGSSPTHLGWRAPFLIFAALGLDLGGGAVAMLRDAPIRHTAAEAGKPAETVSASSSASRRRSCCASSSAWRTGSPTGRHLLGADIMFTKRSG